MKRFIDHIIDQIDSAQLAQLKNECYVFPTKRAAGTYFKQELQLRFEEEVFWSPHIFSIQEFIEYCTKQQKADELTLLLELFLIYRNKENHLRDKELTLEEFLPWGKILLKDFDEIDKYLVDHKAIYTDITDIQTLDSTFEVEEDLNEIVAQFRTILSTSSEQEIIKRFIEIWSITGEVFLAFKSELEKKGIAYEGMLYRSLASSLENPESNEDIIHSFSKVHFCGFSALSLAEEKIIDQLIKKNKAVLYWDADKLFIDPEDKQVAGLFIRRYLKKWPHDGKSSHWIIEDFLSSKKDVTIISAAGATEQAAAANEELLKLKSTCGSTALVLADESLLAPVLQQLPSDLKELNVTMGYAFADSTIPVLLEALFRIQLEGRFNSSGNYFGKVIAEQLLLHPYILPIDKIAINVLSNELKEKQISFVREKEQLGELRKELQALFVKRSSPSELLAQIEKLFLFLFGFYLKRSPKQLNDEGEELRPRRELEFLYRSVESLKEFRSILGKELDQLSLAAVWRLLQDRITTMRIPFRQPKSKGLQIMGLLETRLLDYEQIILLGANEGHLPQARKMNSYIPYAVRKAYRMPTFEEQDAIYSYHFYRLMERAKTVRLIYDNRPASSGVGEASRFLSQWLILAEQKNNPLPAEISLVVDEERVQEKVEVISINKSPELMAFLENRYLNSSNKERKAFSATALTNYIKCPLRFYFSYVVGIKEKANEDPYMDSAVFGQIVHKALELMYQPLVGKAMEAPAFEELLKGDQLSTIVNLAINELFKIEDGDKNLYGKDLLNRDIIIELCREVVKIDVKRSNGQLLKALEEEYKELFLISSSKQVLLQGISDRIEEEGDLLRIVDYKTGKVDNSHSSTIRKDKQAFLEALTTKPAFDKEFQLFLYQLLASRKHTTAKEVTSGWYSMKGLQEGFIAAGDGKPSDHEEIRVFEGRLRNLIAEIFDKTVPFSQTEDYKSCRYCPYKQICNIPDSLIK